MLDRKTPCSVPTAHCFGVGGVDRDVDGARHGRRGRALERLPAVAAHLHVRLIDAQRDHLVARELDVVVVDLAQPRDRLPGLAARRASASARRSAAACRRASAPTRSRAPGPVKRRTRSFSGPCLPSAAISVSTGSALVAPAGTLNVPTLDPISSEPSAGSTSSEPISSLGGGVLVADDSAESPSPPHPAATSAIRMNVLRSFRASLWTT